MQTYRLWIAVLAAGLAAGCGVFPTEGAPCSGGKCDSAGLFLDPADYDVKPSIEFSADGQTIELKGTFVNDGKSRSHLFPLYGLPGMTIDLHAEVSGFNWARVSLHEPPATPWALDPRQPIQSMYVDHGGGRHKVYWDRTGQKVELNPLRRSSSGGVDEELDISLKPMGLHALVVGPRMAEAYGDGKTWTYTVKVTCKDYCTPMIPAGATRFPVYYGHGFNADESSWHQLFGQYMNRVDQGWRTWVRFNTVPAHEQLELRANKLRQHLTRLVRDMEELHRLMPEFYPKDPETPYWRLNLVSHSMGGLDARTLIGDPRANDLCEQGVEAQKICAGPPPYGGGLGQGTEGLDGANKAGRTFCCLDARNLPTSCCAPDEHGNPTLPWRKVIASVTTLSTPHRGSEFADAGLAFIASDPLLKEHIGDVSDDIKDLLFDSLEGKSWMPGMFEPGYGQSAALNTLTNLSRPFAKALGERLPGPPAGRTYSWACATNPGKPCDDPHHAAGQPTAEHAPQTDAADSTVLLPAPLADNTTIFSWASTTCAGVNDWLRTERQCPYGEEPSIGLHSAHQVMNAMGAGPNDGVVSVESAKWGIFMGIEQWRDHFEWTSGEAHLAQFHEKWLELLRRSGY